MSARSAGVRGRVFLRNVDTGDLHYLIWVELRGEDFFWGSPHPAPDVASTRFGPGEEMTIAVSEVFDELPRAIMKTSYHRSGVMHVTSNGSGAQEVRDTYVGKVTSFRGPTLFAALITAVPKTRARYTRKPGRGGAEVRILDVPDSYWSKRLYVDFALTPQGSFGQWPGIGFTEGLFPDIQATPFLSEELNLVMVIRAAPVTDEMSAWQPDKDIVFLMTPPKKIRGG